MIISDLSFQNTHCIKPKVYKDSRGLFFESFNSNKLNTIFKTNIKQINHSSSKKNVIRGIHLQHKNPQHQFFYLALGEVKLVLVDFRSNSNTFLKKIYMSLTQVHPKLIHTPPGVGTSFLTMKTENIMMYFVSKTYDPKNELGILWNDPDLKIDWKIPKDEIIVSEKDNNLPTFNNINNPF